MCHQQKVGSASLMLADAELLTDHLTFNGRLDLAYENCWAPMRRSVI